MPSDKELRNVLAVLDTLNVPHDQRVLLRPDAIRPPITLREKWEAEINEATWTKYWNKMMTEEPEAFRPDLSADCFDPEGKSDFSSD